MSDDPPAQAIEHPRKGTVEEINGTRKQIERITGNPIDSDPSVPPKLVRDRAPERHPENLYGQLQEPQLLPLFLSRKVNEEVRELHEAVKQGYGQLDEIVDVYESLSCLIAALGFSPEQVKDAVKRKRASHGSLRHGILLLERGG